MEIIADRLALPLLFAGAASLLAALGMLAVIRFRKARIGMDVAEFFTRLFRGKGFENLGPESLQERFEQPDWGGLIVDLRDPMNFRQGHIPGAIHRPFDDFLREAVAEGRYGEYRERDIVLVCDTGHLSRVAGEVLGLDLGFTRVFNLRGGMKRWWRWKGARSLRRAPRRCLHGSLAKCCPGLV